MRTTRTRREGRIVWGALVALSLVLVLVSNSEAARSIQQTSAQLLAPVHAVINGIGSAVAGVAETIAEIGRLRTENDQLRTQLAAAEQRQAELQEAARENAHLRALLGVQQVLGWDLLPVRVTAAGTSALTWEVTINAGATAGVRQGMAVVGAAAGGGALAGQVVSIGDEQSIVRLTVDPRSRVVARDQQTDALGVVAGQPGGQLVMDDVAVTDAVAVGDTIVTAGLILDGVAASAYPRGLLVGTVTALEVDPNGLTQRVFVRPALEPRAVEWLMVVRSEALD